MVAVTESAKGVADPLPRRGAEALDRTDVLGVGISAIDLPMAVARIRRWIVTGEKSYVCVTGVHGVMESQRDPSLKAIHNAAGMVTPDGMPMVWLSRLGGHPHVSRVYGPDLMLAVCEASLRPGHGWRHFFYGGAEGVADQLARSLSQRYPGLQVAGTYCPPFGPVPEPAARRIAERINACGADIVWVGLSTPKQERWMAANRDRIDAPVMVGVGAAFDFHAGLKRQAPRWIQRGGLEWLFRLATEPRRLWKRYLVNNTLFVMNVISRWRSPARRGGARGFSLR